MCLFMMLYRFFLVLLFIPFGSEAGIDLTFAFWQFGDALPVFRIQFEIEDVFRKK